MKRELIVTSVWVIGVHSLLTWRKLFLIVRPKIRWDWWSACRSAVLCMWAACRRSTLLSTRRNTKTETCGQGKTCVTRAPCEWAVNVYNTVEWTNITYYSV